MSRDAQKLATLADRAEADAGVVPTLRSEGDALATKVGGDAAWRWRLAVMRATMQSPPDDDAVRELYGELVDRYRDDPARLAALRPFGDEIRRLEADGTLPSVLVARSDRGRRPSR